jgi:type III secretion protein V
LPAFLLDNEIEETVRNGVRQTSVASYIALDPETSKKIVAKIKEAIGDALNGETMPVLITAMDIRRYVRRLVESELPELPVLSHQEIAAEITLQPLGRVGI